MTQFLILTSAEQASGETTLAYNLGVYIEKKNKRNLILSLYDNPRLRAWYNKSPDEMEFTAPDMPDIKIGCEISFNCLEYSSYDYVWLLTGKTKKEQIKKYAELFPENINFIILTSLPYENSPKEIADLWEHIKTATEITPLKIIPNRLNPGEWEQNSKLLFEIIDLLGEEAVAELLPCCSRIKELPLDHKSVWQIPVKEIRSAFEEALNIIINL